MRSVPAYKILLPCYKQIKHEIFVFIQTIQVILQLNNIKYIGYLMRILLVKMFETQPIYFSLQVFKQENTHIFTMPRLTVHMEHKHPKLPEHCGKFKQHGLQKIAGLSSEAMNILIAFQYLITMHVQWKG